MIDLILTNIVSIVLGLGGGIIFYRSRRRKESAEATSSEYNAESVAIANMRDSAAEWKQIAEHREKKIDLRDKKIDTLYADKNKDRDKINTLLLENNSLKLERQSLEFRLCNVRGCLKREPQSNY